ncbi:MAG TPA: regulatory protein RecX [Candidatus Cloacimonas sp.]|jgi:SOS response regulatory protein OraA/RecX|nr:regulatory protein RecX [Candidatus Cloacimonas sp.]HPN26946.1 regulatory protein RecX [Candidatus Cloacimonas sp.]HPZ02544.1 regulatory protein RecX [Candidatus Cloacimonas sp.]HQB50430.1 regulatory protein RecX [Candidatus Cloacimonas sp.]HRR01197.1 regulatory protein RecX [Candidatus Cloacimonas sp.]
MYLKITKKAENDKKSLIIIDNQIWGILPDRILLPFFPIPYTGEINNDQAKELLSLIEKQARQQLLKYLGNREHSSLECKQYLKRKHYPTELIDTLICEFQDKKYIDDHRYVQILISSLISRKKSKNAIAMKLKETRLPTEIWKELLNELYNQEEGMENLKEQITQLRFRYRDLPPSKQKEKIYASLYRKGFNLNDIHLAWQATAQEIILVD